MTPKGGVGLLTATMALGVLMDGIDGSIVNVALPAVAHSFGTDTSVVSWVTIAYFLMMAGFMLPFGRIATAGHIRRVFLLGFALFTISSLACALSPTLIVLIASRVVQGVGAAAIAAVAPMICVKLLPEENLGRSLSIMTIGASMGFALGPALGGIIVEYLSWHWIFLINIPIGLVAIVIGHLSLPPEETGRVRVDLRGSVLLFAAVAAGVIALERLSYPEEHMVCVVGAAVTLVCLAAFVRESLRSDHPLIDVRLFRIRDMDLTLVSYTMINLVYMGVLYVLPFYMDMELGLSSLASGAILLVPSLVTLVLSVPIGNRSDRTGRRGFAIAASVMAVAYTVILYAIEPWMGLPPLIVAALIMGLNWGFCGGTSSGRILDSIPDESKGIGSSLMNFMAYIGSTVGTALFASLLTFGGGSGGVPIEDMTGDAFMSGMELAMVAGVVLSVVSVVTAFLVDERKRTRRTLRRPVVRDHGSPRPCMGRKRVTEGPVSICHPQGRHGLDGQARLPRS